LDFSIKVLQKGKITIPIKIRRMLGIREGDILTLKVVGGRIIILLELLLIQQKLLMAS